MPLRPPRTPATAPAASPARPAAWRGDLKWVVRIFLLALGIRVIYVIQLKSSPWFFDPVMDPLFHHQWAQAVAAGERFMSGPYFRAPLYTWLLGALYRLCGPDLFIARIVQAGLGALNCGLLFLVGRHAFSRTAGILAGLGAALYWPLVYFDAELLSPVLILLLNLLTACGLLWARVRSGWLPWLASGLALGLSAITRPDILLLGPAAAAWAAALYWPRGRRIAAAVGALAAGTALPILPVAVRNAVVGGDCVLIASYGGVNLYIGNNPGADGMTAVIPGDPYAWGAGYAAQIARAEQAAGRRLKPSEVSAWYVRQTWAYVAGHPAEALARVLRKLSYFWTRWEIPNNQDIYFVTSTYTPIVRWLPLGFWLVGPLGLLGLVLSLRRARATFPVWAPVIVYMLIVAAFFASARFRVPAAAFLIVLAAHAVCWCGQAARARRGRALLAAGPVLAAAALLVARIPPQVDTLSVQGYHYAGVQLTRHGRYPEAERMLLESLARADRAGWRHHPFTWYTLGFVRLQLGDYAGAQAALERALALEPTQRGARQQLALALARQGRLDEAVAAYERSRATDPDDPALLAALAQLLATSPDAGQRARARELARAALAAARAEGQAELAEQISRQLAEYER